MTVALERDTPAGWWTRAAAFGIDVLAPLAAVAALLLVSWSAPRGGWVWWFCLVLGAALVLAIAVNRLLLPVITGWSVGRSVVGIAVVDGEGDTPGPWRLLLRDLSHIADTVPFCLGWLWPLLDSRGRTFADMLTHTEVVQSQSPRPEARRLGVVVLAGAAVLAVLAAVIGYTAVYRPQQSVAASRDEISSQGPKLVSEMLSYTVKTAPDDFAHAQTLVTDGYRGELTEQQEMVRKAGLVDNDYWVSNSAVLSSSRDHATMLLLLQGQRGAAPNQRFVTASLRVDYARVVGQWKIDKLTVLAQPKRTAPPQDPAAAQPEKPADKPAPKPSGGGR